MNKKGGRFWFVLVTLFWLSASLGVGYAANNAKAKDVVVLPQPPPSVTSVPDKPGFQPSSAGTTVKLSDAKVYSSAVQSSIAGVEFGNLPGWETGILTSVFSGKTIGDQSGINLSHKIWVISDKVPVIGNHAMFGTILGMDASASGLNLGLGFGIDIALSGPEQKDYGLRFGVCCLREGGSGSDSDLQFNVYMRKVVASF
jgi:hypothetical protein